MTSGKERIRSYSLEGKLLWEYEGQMSNLIIPSPFAVDDLLYVTSGYVGDQRRPVHAIRPGGKGDITPDEEDLSASEYVAWWQPKAGLTTLRQLFTRALATFMTEACGLS